MSEPEISKTPWRYEPFRIVDAHNETLASVSGSRTSNKLDDANGALMAAAPELREEVRRLREALEALKITMSGDRLLLTALIPGRGGWSVEVTERARPFFQAWIEQRNAALAKSEARSDAK